MNLKIIIAGIIGGIVAFFAGWVIYDLALGEVFKEGMSETAKSCNMLFKSNPGSKEMIAMAGSCLAFGLLFSYVFDLIGSMNALKGFFTAAIMSVLMVLFFDLMAFAQMNIMGKRMILIDAVVSILHGGLVGLAVGWWYGRRKN